MPKASTSFSYDSENYLGLEIEASGQIASYDDELEIDSIQAFDIDGYDVFEKLTTKEQNYLIDRSCERMFDGFMNGDFAQDYDHDFT